MEDVVKEDAPVTEEPAKEVVAPGAKTDSELLLKSLQEERDKRRALEDELKRLSEQPVGNFSDEGQLLKKEIESLKVQMTEREKLVDLQSKHPVLADKMSEFNEFRSLPENEGMRLETAAKAFLFEKDLLDTKPRKGLEKDSGGPRTQPKIGRTEEEIADLRKNNFRKYMSELKKGTLRQ